jgi:hypothetical protein
VADQLALALDTTAPGTYRPRGTSSLQGLFRTHLPELLGRYDAEFAARLGKFRRERIAKSVERFVKVIAVITDPAEVRRILLHLVKTGVAPPRVEASLAN